jgi:hypothetical protein
MKTKREKKIGEIVHLIAEHGRAKYDSGAAITRSNRDEYVEEDKKADEFFSQIIRWLYKEFK